jgi:hypothetical protein
MKLDKHEFVSAAEVAQVFEANPGGLKGELRRKGGRPGRTIIDELRLLIIAEHKVGVARRWYERAERRGHAYPNPSDVRDHLGLSGYIHEVVARNMKLGSGRSLEVALSDQKNHRPYLAKSNPDPTVTIRSLP